MIKDNYINITNLHCVKVVDLVTHNIPPKNVEL